MHPLSNGFLKFINTGYKSVISSILVYNNFVSSLCVSSILVSSVSSICISSVLVSSVSSILVSSSIPVSSVSSAVENKKIDLLSIQEMI